MKTFLILLFLCALYALPAPGQATELYASQTGKSCATCHLDPAGGGELTPAGKEFAASRAAQAQPPAGPGPVGKAVRFAAGYLHLITAILWFGTILYVHLVLKPAYAAGGLPRGEVRVGLLSMGVMGVTGIVLTAFRITSLDMLLHTRFGILLLIKISLYLVMVLSAAYVVTVIGPKLKARKTGAAGAAPVLGGDLSEDQLLTCDGKEGHPAYFGYQGKVYDASASKLWKQGVHMGRHNCGMDLTAALDLAPHGPDKVLAMPEVGALLAEGERRAPLHERVFFVMAYMNLTIVFLIVLVLALWRWW
jgi:predicted heme/steroid binding protein